MSRFRPDRDAAREIAKQPLAQRALKRHAEEVAEIVRDIAPDGGPHRGYRETIRVTDGRFNGVEAGEVRIETTDPFGHLIEWGSANNPPYAPLRRAVRAAGLDLRED